jgi:hypothetical protein
MKKLLHVLLTLVMLFGTPALHAQAWGPDGQQPVNWVLTPNNPANGAVAADAYQPADTGETIVDTDWYSTATASNYKVGPAAQRKARFLCRPSVGGIHMDPILGEGQVTFGHAHQFTGHANPTDTDDYTKLRADPSSNCAGGPLNSSDYWEPDLREDLKSGITVGIRPYVSTFYYMLNEDSSTPPEATWLRNNIGFIAATNFMDYNDQARRDEYSAAGLVYPGSPVTPAGFDGWQCEQWDTATGTYVTKTVTRVASRMQSDTGAAISTYSRHLAAPDGSDPWGGTCQVVDGHPTVLLLELAAPQCWDGHNLRSPDGRGHVRYYARTPDSAHVHLCPDNWVLQPQLTVKTEYNVNGPAEYTKLYLESDRMHMATPACPDPGVACAASLDPCRQISVNYCNGSTAHFDYIFGWKKSVSDLWQRECLGLSVDGVAPVNGPAECDGSTVSQAYELKSGVTSPNTALTGGCAQVAGCTASLVPGDIKRYNAPPSGTQVTVGHFTNHINP